MELTVDEIKKLLPHRYPFLLLDRVEQLKPGTSGVGIKNVTISEPYFQGHFPSEAIMPGVLIVEAMAQATAVVYGTGALEVIKAEAKEKVIDKKVDEAIDIASLVGYLVRINDMKFMKPVVPGDQLQLKVIIQSTHGILSKVKVHASVNKVAVARGTLTVSQKPA